MTTSRLENKVAVITGGASGMGRAAALRFLEEGARVVINDLNPKTAEEVLDLAGTLGRGGAIRFLRGDVSQEQDVAAAVALALEAFGRLDCMFNNAGLAGAMGPITHTLVEDWDRTCAVLLRSVFLGIKHAGRAMQAQGSGGSIINTASVAGQNGGGGPPAYSAAKAGVLNLTRSAAVELAPARIRVNAIAPGGIHTPMLPVATDEDMRRFMKGRQPWPETGLAQDIAHAALYLASDESRFCTGTTLTVDGGLMAWGPALFPHVGAHSQQGFYANNTGEGAAPGLDSTGAAAKDTEGAHR